MPGARNPKEARTSLYLTADMNARLEALADRAGLNKGVVAAFCLAIGVNAMEPVFQVGMKAAIEQVADDKLKLLQADLHDIAPALVPSE